MGLTGPMGPIQPSGEPTGGSGNDKVDFPSISRAEQAQQTQGVVREIARDLGWETPQTRDLPKADGKGGLEEGTPLASRDSLTPGQKARIEKLPQPSLGVSAKAPDDMIGRDDPAATRAESYAAQAARKELPSAVYENDKMHLQDNIVVSHNDTTGARTYHESWARMGPTSAPVLAEFAAHDFRGLSNSERDGAYVGVSVAREWEQEYKEKLAEKIEQHRYAARRLYERDPQRYAGMNPEEFVEQLADYMRDEDELSTIEEVHVGDQAAQLSQVERITSELGPDADVQTLLNELSEQADLPSMSQAESFEAYIKRVKAQMEQEIMLAKAKARQLRADMASKYGGEPPVNDTEPASAEPDDEPHIERSTN